MRIARNLLWIDCIAAASAGIAVLLLGGWLARLYGLPQDFLILIGTANLLYGCFSFTLAIQRHRSQLLIGFLVVANSLWSLVCIGMAAAFSGTATFFGIGHLIGEALFVGGLAGSEWTWRKQLLAVAQSVSTE